METDTALVRSYGAAALYPVTSVHTDFTFVIEPRNSEDDDSFWLHNPFEYLEVHEVWMLYNIRSNAFKHFLDCLVKFLFSRVSGDKICHETINIILCELVHNRIYLLGVYDSYISANLRIFCLKSKW